MKKLFKLLLLTVLAFNFLGVARASELAAKQFKPATLINYGTGYKVAVSSQNEADKYFALGYSLYKNLLGFTVVTNYSTVLTTSITASQNTIPVGTTKDKKGVQLSTTTLGMKIYLNIEPGSKKEELVVCTGVSGNNWTGCTRGLAFSGTDESAHSDYQYNHSQGSTVVMSNIHYIYNTYVDTLNPTSDSSYTPTTNYNLTTKTWVENRNGFWEGAVANYSSLPTSSNADGSARVTLDDSKLYVWASSTQSWVLAGSGGGAGTVYKTVKLGNEAVGDDNRTFQMESGSFVDEKYLQVYLNGVLMEIGASADYQTSGSNTVVFNYDVEDLDKITLLVVSVDLYNPAWGLVNDNILPDTDSAYDVGSTSKKFKDLHLSGDVTFGGDLNGDGSNLDDGANGKLKSGTAANELVRLDGSAKLPAVDGSQLTNAFKYFSESDTLRLSADTERLTSATSYTMVKNTVVYGAGKIRIKFSIRSNNNGGNNLAYGQIYLNGVAVGTERSNTGGPTEYSEDIYVSAGDKVQIYAKGNGATTSYITNFRLYFDINSSDTYGVVIIS